jgi:hypothetical protein
MGEVKTPNVSHVNGRFTMNYWRTSSPRGGVVAHVIFLPVRWQNVWHEPYILSMELWWIYASWYCSSTPLQLWRHRAHCHSEPWHDTLGDKCIYCKSVQVRKCVETSLTQHKLRHFQVMLISGFGCKVVERTLDWPWVNNSWSMIPFFSSAFEMRFHREELRRAGY